MKRTPELYDKVLRMVNNFWLTEYRSPTIREICGETGARSTSHIRLILEVLAERGYLVKGKVAGEKPGKFHKYYYPLWVKDAIDSSKEITLVH